MEYFTRDGQKAPCAPRFDNKGKPYFMQARKCGRCGGLGGSDKWAHTGYTCYDCGGSGRSNLGDLKVTLYLAEELTKLNAAQAKREATRAKKAQAAEEKRQNEANARRAEFMAEFGELLTKAEAFEGRSEFIRDVRARALREAAMTEKQAVALRNAVAKFAAGDAQKAASAYIGEVGQRLRRISATVTNTFHYPASRFGYRNEAISITIMRTDDGNAIKVKSSSFGPKKGAKIVFDATVKEHSEYNGEKQTVLQRVAAHSVIAPEREKEAA